MYFNKYTIYIKGMPRVSSNFLQCGNDISIISSIFNLILSAKIYGCTNAEITRITRQSTDRFRDDQDYVDACGASGRCWNFRSKYSKIRCGLSMVGSDSVL